MIIFLFNWVMEDKYKGVEDKQKADEQYFRDNFPE
jgi:hypothetical protein